MNKPPLAPHTLSDTIFTEAEVEPTEKDKSPFPRPHDTVTDADFFALSTPDLDIREWFGPSLLLIILSPLCTSILSWYQLALLAVGRLCLPPIIRQRYPHFMRTDVLEELRIRAGGGLSLCGSITAFILQAHDTRISLAVKFHSEFYSRPILRFLRTFLYVEVALNGTSEEKEQTASWLRWMHRHIHGIVTDEMRTELGIPEGVDAYGYIDELKAYVMETLTWATISFQTKYGRKLSKRGKDLIVLEYTCAGLRLGVPEDLLAKDYDSFLVSFNRRLDILDAGYSLTRTIVENIERSVCTAEKSWVTHLLFRMAYMIGFDLLPQRVQEQYQLKLLSKTWQRAVQRILIAVLWVVYPMLMWIPLRGMITLILALLASVLHGKSSLQAIHSMDILSDKPAYSRPSPDGKGVGSLADAELPSYLEWLNSGKDGRPFLQALLVRVLATQLRSDGAPRWSHHCITPWLSLPIHVIALTLETAHKTIRGHATVWSTQIKESTTFASPMMKIPRHGVWVHHDGNRRYARQLGQPVLYGHSKGAQTAANILKWWIRFMPNISSLPSVSAGPEYLSVWAFSSENFKRSDEELNGLFALMQAEFKSLAFTSLVHLFQIRVRVIGNRSRPPNELLGAIELLEQSTADYVRLNFQIAVGYGGRDEIVQSAKRVLDLDKEISETSLSEETFCGQAGIPPVDLIVRTSEHRTSGFFLWDTQAAELHFIDKLWPELHAGDWLNILASFSRREMRWGQ